MNTRSRSTNDARTSRIRARAVQQRHALAMVLCDAASAATICSLLPGQAVVRVRSLSAAFYALPDGLNVGRIEVQSWQEHALRATQDGGFPVSRQTQKPTAAVARSWYQRTPGVGAYVPVPRPLAYDLLRTARPGSETHTVPLNWPRQPGEPWATQTRKVHLSRRMQMVTEFSVRETQFVNGLKLSRCVRKFPGIAKRFRIHDLRINPHTWNAGAGKVFKMDQAWAPKSWALYESSNSHCQEISHQLVGHPAYSPAGAAGVAAAALHALPPGAARYDTKR